MAKNETPAPPAEPENTTTWAEPEGWRPEAGSIIEGKVIEVDTGYSDFLEGNYPIVTIEPADGSPVAVHGFQQLLMQKLIALRPTVGESIKVECGGKRPTRDGKRSVVLYKVTMPDRENVGANVWDTFGSPAASKPAPADVPADTEGLTQPADAGDDPPPF
jgi:hypothetical protein